MSTMQEPSENRNKAGRQYIRVLAIDPGYDRMGLAVLEGDPSKPILVWSECVMPPKGAHEMRLASIYEAIEKVLEEYRPDRFALETLFLTNNQKTAMGVSEARGAALAAVGKKGIPVNEFTPQQVKLAVTGYGAADKGAVSRMIPHLLTLPPKKRYDDELDAIAVGIAALAVRH